MIHLMFPPVKDGGRRRKDDGSPGSMVSLRVQRPEQAYSRMHNRVQRRELVELADSHAAEVQDVPSLYPEARPTSCCEPA